MLFWCSVPAYTLGVCGEGKKATGECGVLENGLAQKPKNSTSAAGTRPSDLKPASETFRETFREDKLEHQNS